MSLYKQALEAVEPRATFMDRVHGILLSHGVSHARLAMAAGIHPAQFSHWINGQQPTLENMLRLLAALDGEIYG